ncbi:MAG: Gfo/Idh/MocA family oxidoreductase [Pseudomonadota bacterium]
MSYNIGIVGAARRHQGTGPFIARTFNQLGHNIAGIIGTHENSVTETKSHLKNQYGISTQGYTSLKDLLNEHQIDALIISSPPETHLQFLEEALKNNLHVFCEKPLWWPSQNTKIPTNQNYIAQIQNCLNLAIDNQCMIHLNAQWPYTLPDFYRLYPHLLSTETSQFTMDLSPQSEGVSMLVDAASHGLSMLYYLAGQGEITDIVFTGASNQGFTASFNYQHAVGVIETTLGFTKSLEVPKPARYIINHCKVDRKVSLPDYQIGLQSTQHSIPIKDPLLSSVEDFIASIEAGLQTDTTMLMSGANHLHQLIESFN